MGEWATTIGIIGGGLLGALAAWIAKSTNKANLDDRFMERLLTRVDMLEKQNAAQAKQIELLTTQLAEERQTVRELRHEVAELKQQLSTKQNKPSTPES